MMHGRRGGIEYRAMGFEIWNKTCFFQLRIHIHICHIDAIAPGNPSPIDMYPNTYSNFVAPAAYSWNKASPPETSPVGEARSKCPQNPFHHIDVAAQCLFERYIRYTAAEKMIAMHTSNLHIPQLCT